MLVSMLTFASMMAIGHRIGVTAPTGGGCPAQGDIRTSLAMDRCAKGEGGVWVNPGGGDCRDAGATIALGPEDRMVQAWIKRRAVLAES